MAQHFFNLEPKPAEVYRTLLPDLLSDLESLLRGNVGAEVGQESPWLTVDVE